MTLRQLARIAFCLVAGLLLAASLPSDSVDVVFCPQPGAAIDQPSWGPGAGVWTSNDELMTHLFLETTAVGELGDSHLVCTYRLDEGRQQARFHLRMQMPESYSCTTSGREAFVCRVRW